MMRGKGMSLTDFVFAGRRIAEKRRNPLGNEGYPVRVAINGEFATGFGPVARGNGSAVHRAQWKPRETVRRLAAIGRCASAVALTRNGAAAAWG
ncbi:hypothetical protein NA8A_17510 [Nitratireductor indicus C115]|uniref:Uncharacterized protein n=1 Tax=Nitratireductor indicus C115 TaxID=1231190 RepID=K2NT61_9HYPH|nr:hypothetical protein NA8A_17510 [Nitratireductor indicus C115]